MMRIGIDPGHGGSNVGCAGGGLHEEELTLRTAMGVQRMMINVDSSIQVVLSREHDDTVSLSERAKRLQGCAFIYCLHYDSAAKPEDGAMGTYGFAEDEIANEVGFHLEQSAPIVLRPKTPKMQPVAPADWTSRAYNCLVHHRPTPCLLVELAFLSNPKHTEYLHGPNAMTDLGLLLCSGVLMAEQMLQRTPPRV